MGGGSPGLPAFDVEDLRLRVHGNDGPDGQRDELEGEANQEDAQDQDAQVPLREFHGGVTPAAGLASARTHPCVRLSARPNVSTCRPSGQG